MDLERLERAAARALAEDPAFAGRRPEWHARWRDYRSYRLMGEYPPRVTRLARELATEAGLAARTDDAALDELCLELTAMLERLSRRALDAGGQSGQ